MCGILVHIGPERIGPDHPALEIIRHRGPDGAGAEHFPLADGTFLSLAHRRLAIIDLDVRSNQPMSYADGALWLIFNGEIYNYRELRAELTASGCEFRTTSDTEVILAAWQRWGPAMVPKFNGMFAFALFDRHRQRLFMARDRFGIKPLAWHNTPQGFTVVSEYKQLTGLPGFSPRANRTALFHYLNSGDTDYAAETLWEGVTDLLPGHFLDLDLNTWKPGSSISPQAWYTLPQKDLSGISFPDAVAEYRRLLEQSVRFRLRADVPVGCLLSGGMDSSTLVGLAAQAPREQSSSLKTFSSCYENSPVDERRYIQAVLDKHALESSLHFPKPADVLQHLDKVIWHNDIPVRHGSPVSHWLLYQHLRADNDSRIVIIEGQGGDEFLGGYGEFFWARLTELLRAGRLVEFTREFHAFRRETGTRWRIAARVLRLMLAGDHAAITVNPALQAEALVGPGEIPGGPAPRLQPSVADLHRARLTVIRYILHNVDRNSMAHSRETRVPFLDPELAEFTLNLPAEYKLYRGVSKRILREAAKDVLPAEVLARRDKQGYSSPTPTWLKRELRNPFREILAEAIQRPYVRDPQAVLQKFDRYADGQGHFDPVWWHLACAHRWIEMFGMGL